MKLAVQYTPQLVSLLNQGAANIDYFKCPAWPDLIPEAAATRPAYVHFPLHVGKGISTAYDAETRQTVDWQKVDQLLAVTDTPYVNLHLSILADDYPEADAEHIVDCTLPDIATVAARYGQNRVIIENDHAFGGAYLPLSYQASFIGQIVEDSGCGLLLDLAHARLAADRLGMDTREYIQALPVHRLRELHVSGVQRITDERAGAVLAKLSGYDELYQFVERFRGELLDHQPMSEADWALTQIRSGRWSSPWIVACEYSGVGPLWQAFTDAAVLQMEVPRLWQMMQNE